MDRHAVTTYFPFQPSPRQVPSFSPTLDGQQYNCTCTWNLFGQRYYLNCFDTSGNLVFSRALVDTPPAQPLEALSWSSVTRLVTATTQTPHGWTLGAVIELTIAGSAPDAFNGTFSCRVTGPSSFVYSLAADPGDNVTPGSVSFLISLSAGYFASTLVYRGGNFEVSP